MKKLLKCNTIKIIKHLDCSLIFKNLKSYWIPFLIVWFVLKFSTSLPSWGLESPDRLPEARGRGFPFPEKSWRLLWYLGSVGWYGKKNFHKIKNIIKYKGVEGRNQFLRKIAFWTKNEDNSEEDFDKILYKKLSFSKFERNISWIYLFFRGI